MPYLAQPSQTCAFPPSFVFKTLCLPSLFFVFLFLRDIVSVACQAWSCDTYFCFITEYTVYYTPQNILSLSGKVTLQYGGKRDVFIQFLVSPAVWRHNYRYRGKQFFLIYCAVVFVLLSIFARGKNYAKASVAVLRHNQRYSGRPFFPDLLCFRICASFHICSRKKIMPKCQSQY